jgi:hypothetical protein
MSIKRRSEVCDIEGKCMGFNAMILSNRVHLGQISL